MPHPERGELPGNSVNMAANLSSVSEDNELLVSERFFKNIQHELVLNIITGEKISQNRR
jgi:hypothetical protein